MAVKREWFGVRPMSRRGVKHMYSDGTLTEFAYAVDLTVRLETDENRVIRTVLTPDEARTLAIRLLQDAAQADKLTREM